MSYSAGSWRRSLLVAAALVAGGTALAASSPGAVAREAAPDATGQAWVGSWSTTPLVGSAGFNNQTLREIVHISLGGDEVRIRLTNAFGADGVVVDDVTVGVRDVGAALAPGTERPVTFGGARHVTLPAGAEVLSDPVPLAVAPQQDLAVSLHVPAPTGPATRHAGAYTTSYAASGDHAAEPSASAFTSTLSSWYLLDGVDVLTRTGDRGGRRAR